MPIELAYYASGNRISEPTFGIPSIYCQEAKLLFTKMAQSGVVLDGLDKYKIDITISRLKTKFDRNGKSTWDNSDVIFCWAITSRGAALFDWKNPNRKISFRNAYSSDHVANQGFVGGGNTPAFNIFTGYNPGDGKDYNYRRNDCSYHLFTFLHTTTASRVEIAALNNASTSGIAMQSYPGPGIGINSNFLPTTTFTKYMPYGHTWTSINRTARLSTTAEIMGVVVRRSAEPSLPILNQQIAHLVNYRGGGIFDGSGAFLGGSPVLTSTSYSENIHAVVVYGNGHIKQDNLREAFNEGMFLDNATCNIYNRIIFEGDSMVGDPSVALSANSALAVQTFTNLGYSWSGCVVSVANDSVANMVTTGAAEIDAFRNKNLRNDIVVIRAGTNDAAAGQTGLQIYNNMVSFCQARKNAGFKVIIIGFAARGGGVVGTYETSRSDYNTLMNADFNVATVDTNVYASNTVTYADRWINVSADSRYNDFTDPVNYQADEIHHTLALYTNEANVYLAPAVLQIAI